MNQIYKIFRVMIICYGLYTADASNLITNNLKVCMTASAEKNR